MTRETENSSTTAIILTSVATRGEIAIEGRMSPAEPAENELNAASMLAII